MDVKMKRQAGFQIGLIAMALVAGVLFGFQRVNWIETQFGIDPDGGNGFLELLWVIVPIVAGLAFAIPGYLGLARQAAHMMAEDEV